MLDAIDHKFPPIQSPDDVQWPSPQTDKSLPASLPLARKTRMNSSLSENDDVDDDTFPSNNSFLRDYWRSIRQKYKTHIPEPSLLSASEAATLPNNWTVVNISVTPDKSTLFCCRRQGGDDSSRPLTFCIPLKERREQTAGDGEEDYLTFDGAISELQDIIHSSNESTKAAVHIKSDDENARSNWWKQRGLLDVRMRELLANIEYCWLGAFKVLFFFFHPYNVVGPHLFLHSRRFSALGRRCPRK
jgi:separase